jgi:rare lipoprotein A (peptidoglycan hydrolase)
MKGRIVDLSAAAATTLDIRDTAKVRVEVFKSDQVR